MAELTYRVQHLVSTPGVAVYLRSPGERSYRAAFLNPGTDRVTISLPGFSKFVSDQIEGHVAGQGPRACNCEAQGCPGG